MILKIYFQPLPLSYVILDLSLMSSSIKSSPSHFFPYPTWALARSHSFIKALKSIPTATNLIHSMTLYLGFCRFFASICTVCKSCTCTSSCVSCRNQWHPVFSLRDERRIASLPTQGHAGKSLSSATALSLFSTFK